MLRERKKKYRGKARNPELREMRMDVSGWQLIEEKEILTLGYMLHVTRL